MQKYEYILLAYPGPKNKGRLHWTAWFHQCILSMHDRVLLWGCCLCLLAPGSVSVKRKCERKQPCFSPPSFLNLLILNFYNFSIQSWLQGSWTHRDTGLPCQATSFATIPPPADSAGWNESRQRGRSSLPLVGVCAPCLAPRTKKDSAKSPKTRKQMKTVSNKSTHSKHLKNRGYSRKVEQRLLSSIASTQHSPSTMEGEYKSRLRHHKWSAWVLPLLFWMYLQDRLEVVEIQRCSPQIRMGWMGSLNSAKTIAFRIQVIQVTRQKSPSNWEMVTPPREWPTKPTSLAPCCRNQSTQSSWRTVTLRRATIRSLQHLEYIEIIEWIDRSTRRHVSRSISNLCFKMSEL